jgi:hypothetical protein
MITDPDGVESEFLGGMRQAHEGLGGINITQIGQANTKLHTVSYGIWDVVITISPPGV